MDITAYRQRHALLEEGRRFDINEYEAKISAQIATQAGLIAVIKAQELELGNLKSSASITEPMGPILRSQISSPLPESTLHRSGVEPRFTSGHKMKVMLSADGILEGLYAGQIDHL